VTDFRCSDEARLRDDPIVGTAPPARRWLLVEQPAGWAIDAFEGLSITPAVRASVQAAARASGARILLIRRPGRPANPQETRRSWCVVDARSPEALRWGSWQVDRDSDLLDAADVLRDVIPPASDASGATPLNSDVREAGTAPDSPGLLLVCTHGRHDVCCAVRGRPVAAVLARSWPEATWECSHVGGDRFAANVVVLPEGACYGGLDAENADRVVGDHLAGRPDPAYLRGASGHPAAVQAALVAVHRELGPLAWGSVRARGHRELAAGRSVVDLDVAPVGRVRVTVHEEVRDAQRLTCRALRDNRATVPVVVGLRTISA